MAKKRSFGNIVSEEEYDSGSLFYKEFWLHQSTYFLRKVHQVMASDNPGLHREFLDALHNYQKREWNVRQLKEEMGRVFANYPKLLSLFHKYFIGDHRNHSEFVDSEFNSYCEKLQEKLNPSEFIAFLRVIYLFSAGKIGVVKCWRFGERLLRESDCSCFVREFSEFIGLVNSGGKREFHDEDDNDNDNDNDNVKPSGVVERSAREIELFEKEDKFFEINMLHSTAERSVKYVEDVLGLDQQNSTEPEQMVKAPPGFKQLIERMYGDQGLLMLELLDDDPNTVLPLILVRLKQKKAELEELQNLYIGRKTIEDLKMEEK